MGLRPGIRGSHSEFAVTQLLVDLPTKFGHVLLGEAEWLRQGQVLAVLGVNKAGHENHLVSIPLSQDLCYTFHMTSHLIFQRTCPNRREHFTNRRIHGPVAWESKKSLTLNPRCLFGT